MNFIIYLLATIGGITLSVIALIFLYGCIEEIGIKWREYQWKKNDKAVTNIPRSSQQPLVNNLVSSGDSIPSLDQFGNLLVETDSTSDRARYERYIAGEDVRNELIDSVNQNQMRFAQEAVIREIERQSYNRYMNIESRDIPFETRSDLPIRYSPVTEQPSEIVKLNRIVHSTVAYKKKDRFEKLMKE